MNIPHNKYQIFILFFSVLIFAPICTQYQHVVLDINFNNQPVSKAKTTNSPHHDFSYDRAWNNSNFNASRDYKNHFNRYSADDFKYYFTTCEYTENQILNEHCLYMFDEFVKLAQTYSSYKCTVQQIHAQLKNLNCLQKAYYIAKGSYCAGLQKRINYLYNQLCAIKNDTPTHKKPIIYDHSVTTFQNQQSEYTILEPIYRSYTPSLSNAIKKRIDAYNTITSADYALRHTNKSYTIPNNAQQLLHKYGYETKPFTECFGNPLHHAIHKESLDILEHIDSLSPNSVLYDHQETLIDFTAAIVDYNHAGLTDKAMHIADLCWTLLDYGQTVAEGVALGMYSAVEDILTNPIEATVCIVAGKQVLAYQLCKVLYNVADIGITATTDFDYATKKWNKYVKPLNAIIDSINNKEISLRDVVKGSTALVVSWKAQSTLLGGLSKFCNTIKHKSINFAKNSSLGNAQEYLTTPEGLLFKATAESNKIKQSGQANTASHLKNSVASKTSKVKPSTKQKNLPAINQTSTAILRNGYYEVNGFKFTEYYYNRLWNNGREAPSLAAQAILENTTAIIPDPEQIPGFFKYFSEGWEMIYNPTTKIVSHIQQIRKSK